MGENLLSGRLLSDPALPGRYNMALDRAVQICVEDGDSPPSLRLYRWEVPTATLGRFQRLETVDLDYAIGQGIALARRFTGGRGVLHDDELTYSFVASRAHGIPAGVKQSYLHIAQALVAAFTALGVDVAIEPGTQKASLTGSCYLTSTPADLCSGAAKLSGSAQVWLGETVLQHGCFVRSRDVDREATVFRLDAQQTEALRSGASTLADLLHEVPDIATMSDAIASAFSSTMGIDFLPGDYTERELELAQRLANSPETAVEG